MTDKKQDHQTVSDFCSTNMRLPVRACNCTTEAIWGAVTMTTRAEAEAVLTAAVKASLRLPAVERLAHVGRHLRAHYQGEALPQIETAGQSSTIAAHLDEVNALSQTLTRVLNQTRGRSGWPLMAMAEELLSHTSTPQLPPNSMDHLSSERQIQERMHATRLTRLHSEQEASASESPTTIAVQDAAPAANDAPVARATVPTIEAIPSVAPLAVAFAPAATTPLPSIQALAQPMSETAPDILGSTTELQKVTSYTAKTSSYSQDAEGFVFPRRSSFMRRLEPAGKQKQPSSTTVNSGDADARRAVALAAFQKYDSDHSGAIDKPELIAAMFDLGHVVPINGTAEQQSAFLERAWAIADVDGNGEVDEDEFVEFYTATLVVFDAFQKYDTNGSGAIDKQELFGVMMDLGQVCPANGTAKEQQDYLETSFALADVDGNGVVDIDEFIQFYNATLKAVDLEERARAAFCKYDIDESNCLEKAEVRGLLARKPCRGYCVLSPNRSLTTSPPSALTL